MRKVYQVVVLFISVLLLMAPFPQVSNAAANPKTVVLDPGHGGKYSGTCGYSGNNTGYCEEQANLDVALKVRDLLRNTDIRVLMTRDTDKHFSEYTSGDGGDLDVRTKLANELVKGNNDNSIFISIHHNASPYTPYVKGLETYYYDGLKYYDSRWPHDPLQIEYLPESRRLAEDVHPRLVSNLGYIDRGVHSDEAFYVIRNAQMPSILVELGFMTNREEEANIKSPANQQKAAEAISNAVINYFKVFEVYDSKNNRLGVYATKEEAIKQANNETRYYRKVIDKDKQSVIYENYQYEVHHKYGTRISDYITKEDAINKGKSVGSTRVVEKGTNYTVWSDYLTQNYRVISNGSTIGTYYDYKQAEATAKNRTNSKILNITTQKVVWSNDPGVSVSANAKLKTLSGSNRYETAVKLSQEMYPKGFSADKPMKTVILTTGEDFADALSSSPLADEYGQAPILLTKPTKLPDTVLTEMKRLGTKEVVIIGGELAVSPQVQSRISSQGIKTTRISGSNRFETNRLILGKLNSVEGAFVAAGRNYADALGAAPVAAAKNWSIVLTESDSIENESLALLKNKPVSILGGAAAVSSNVENSIKKVNSNVERIGGQDRYETLSRLLWYNHYIMNSSEVLVSTGNNFPDALAAAPLAFGQNSPLLLVGKNIDSGTESLLMKYAEETSVSQIKVIGGVVEDYNIDKIREILH
ncbi:cell wall-binding repeat-containing protein [Bacillus salacetis]|uniref:cell wall-binding repeat-containing protein n=1 Tax=Bacillus salacetis TaxID=2315464 RepID=UPI003BA1863A